jgi:hypothetical protein
MLADTSMKVTGISLVRARYFRAASRWRVQQFQEPCLLILPCWLRLCLLYVLIAFGASHWRMYQGYDPCLVALPHKTVLQMFEWDMMADPAKGLSTRRNATL